MPPSPASIRDTLTQHRPALDQFCVKRLALFGSGSRGEPTQGDLDFMVEFSRLPGLLDYMGLKFFLEDLFQCPVDLVTRASCPERFLKRIQPDLQDVA